jgi:radical SAM protein with 4Fe4S-binding SPASM domain
MLLKPNINRHTLDFLSSYRRASKSLGGHSLARMTRFGLNVFIRPVRSLYYPEFLKAEITTSCNMSCMFCGAARSHGKSGGRNGKHMNLETLQEVLDNVPMIRWIDLQGVGEPLMHPKFTEILRLMTLRGISVQFTTNGILLDNMILKAISEGMVHSITISLSASSAERYLELHGSDFFGRVIENIRGLVRARRVGIPRIRILAVVMSYNLNELTRLIEIAKDVRVDSLVLSAYKRISENDWNEPDRIELCQAVADAKAYAKNAGMPLELEVPTAGENNPINGRGVSPSKCLWPWVSLAVNVDGEVMPCCYSMGNSRYEIGNLTHKNIYDVFNSNAYMSFRAALNLGNTQGLVCHNCNDHAW